MDAPAQSPEAEQLIAADPSTFLRVAESLPVGVALLEPPRYLYVYANRRFRNLIGADTLVGTLFSDTWPADVEEALSGFSLVMSTGEVIETSNMPLPRATFSSETEPAYFTFHFCRTRSPLGPLLLIEATETTVEVRARHKAQDALSEAAWIADTLSDVFEAMDDGFFTLDREWRLTYLNTRAEQLLHGERVDLIGRSLWEVFPGAAESVFGEQFRKAISEKVPVSFEEYFAPNDMWAAVHATPSTAGLSVYLSNVTEQRRAEMALATSEGQLRAFIENSPSVVFMKDLDGRLIRVNDEFARRFDKSKDEIVGLTDDDLLPAVTAGKVQANDRSVLATGEPRQFEEEVQFPDGRSVTYLTVKFPLKDSSGRIYGVAGIATDINERIAQQRALAESEQRFRKIFEEGPLGIVLLDTALTIRQVNDRYAEMLGYSKAELVGKVLGDVLSGEGSKSATQAPGQLVRGEIPYYRVEQRLERRDGSDIWVSAHGSLIRDDKGSPMFVMLLAEDISHRHAAELALREKDRQIRAAYSDVIAVVTGGKLVIMTPEEIAECLGHPESPVWHVQDYEELAPLRRRLASALLEQGMSREEVESYVLAACEAFTNAVKHGGGGEVSVHRRGRVVQIAVSDHGHGIDFDNLPRATLLTGFSTAQTLGAGFTIMLEICDRVLLSTQTGYTIVVLESGPIERRRDPER